MVRCVYADVFMQANEIGHLCKTKTNTKGTTENTNTDVKLRGGRKCSGPLSAADRRRLALLHQTSLSSLSLHFSQILWKRTLYNLYDNTYINNNAKYFLVYFALYDSRGDWPGCTTHHSQTAISFTGRKSLFRILLGYFYNINWYIILSRPKVLHRTSLCNMSKYFSQIGNIS